MFCYGFPCFLLLEYGWSSTASKVFITVPCPLGCHRLQCVYPPLLRNRSALTMLQAIGPRFEAHKIPNPNLESHMLYPEIRPPAFSGDRRWITCFDPATGFHLETVMADSSDEITRKIARAADAQKQWKATSFRDRRRVMLSLKKWLVDNQETCARVACRDTGKTCKRPCRSSPLNIMVTLWLNDCSQCSMLHWEKS